MAASRPKIRKVEDKSRKKNEWHSNNKRYMKKEKNAVQSQWEGPPNGQIVWLNKNDRNKVKLIN